MRCSLSPLQGSGPCEKRTQGDAQDRRPGAIWPGACLGWIIQAFQARMPTLCTLLSTAPFLFNLLDEDFTYIAMSNPECVALESVTGASGFKHGLEGLPSV